MRLAQNIKTLRQNTGLTLEEMAEKLGLSGKSSYYAYEEGIAEPPIKNLIILSKIFKVNIHTLILGEVKVVGISDKKRRELKIRKLERKISKLKQARRHFEIIEK